MSLSGDSSTEPVWSKEDATIGDVLAALEEVRNKFAIEEAGDEEHIHPRNSVMTLVSVAPDEQQQRLAEKTTRIIGTQHPALAIVIREEAPIRGRHLDASISTEVRRPQSSCAEECEIITLHVRGKASEHLGALVDPLLVSGVPTYLWWLGTPPFGRRELMDALRICDGLVVDSATFGEPFRAFHGLSRLVKVAHHSLGLGDMQWSRLRPWRENIAQFFVPPDRRRFLSGVAEVGVDYTGEGRGNRISAALVTGWIASALGWRLRKATAGAGGVVVATYQSSKRLVEVNFRSVAGDNLAPGEVSAVRISGSAQGTMFRLSVLHDPPRNRLPSEPEYRTLHPTGGEDDAGMELAERRAEWHRDVLHENLGSLHHTATGDPPGESTPRMPMVFNVERRRGDSGRVLLTMIEIGEGEPLRHVQQLDADDEVTLLLDLLSTGTRDAVYNRSLAAAAELMERV